MGDLKNCLVCGGAAELHKDEIFLTFLPACNKCHRTCGRFFDENTAIAAWNEFNDVNDVNNVESGMWMPCKNGRPCNPGDYIVTVKEKYSWEAEWNYDVDWATSHCDNGIDHFWSCFNYRYEGHQVHVVAWMLPPEPYKE